MTVCLSVRPFVHPSVRPSVHQSFDRAFAFWPIRSDLCLFYGVVVIVVVFVVVVVVVERFPCINLS